MMPHKNEDEPPLCPNEPASLRADLMKRWFAVAISVGFAATLANMQWLRDGDWPTRDEVDQLFRLFVAMTATLLSWEGYFLSIAGKPLRDFTRFAIDFVLVLLYMALLITSNVSNFWLTIHAITFFVYMNWDLVSIIKYRVKYLPKHQEFDELPSVSEVYVGGFVGNPNVLPGPIITVSWAAYFIGLPIIYCVGMPNAARWFSVFVFVGLICYRLDKQRSFGSLVRAPLITGLLIIIWLHCHFVR